MYTKRELKRAAGIIRQIARDNHVTEEEVRRDMQEAMDVGRSNPNPVSRRSGSGLSMPGTSRRWKSSFCGWRGRLRRVGIEVCRGLTVPCFSSVIRI